MAIASRKVLDDRRQVRDLYGTGYGVEARTERTVLTNDELRKIRKRASRGWRRGKEDLRNAGSTARESLHETLLAMVLMAGAFGIVRAITWAVGASWNSGLVFVTWIYVVLLLVLARRGFSRRYGPGAIARSMLAEGRCPSCAYSLVGAARDPGDGCAVCPECGAAWKLPRDPCPTCGYDLALVRTDSRGLITCPACKQVYREVV